jgi:hypothetical protein
VEIYVATVLAKEGHEDDVARFYVEQEEALRGAKGFRSRQILQARPGTMIEAVKKHLTEEQIARHSEAEGPGGVQFIIIEQWDSVDEKTTYSRSIDSSRNQALIPHLLPEHSHEYYKDVTPS